MIKILLANLLLAITLLTTAALSTTSLGKAVLAYHLEATLDILQFDVGKLKGSEYASLEIKPSVGITITTAQPPEEVKVEATEAEDNPEEPKKAWYTGWIPWAS
jgi:hypothetical protein